MAEEKQDRLLDETLDLKGTDEDLAKLATMLNPVLAKIVEVRVARETRTLDDSAYDRFYVQGGWDKGA